ncbi:MAG: DapH/DapD/GlmU-related protein [Phycisphaeraceae bacterium]
MNNEPSTTRMQTKEQQTRYSSPWSKWSRVKLLLWRMTWLLLFRPTLKPFKGWRNFLLRLFGAKITGRPFVSPSAIVYMPWHLTLEDHVCLGPGSEVYNLGHVTLRARCTVAQQVYLCAGTHDFSDPKLPLVVGTIEIGEEAFIGVRALVLPGVHIGARCVVGAGAVVTRDTPEGMICAGNPAKPIRKRQINDSQTSGEEAI